MIDFFEPHYKEKIFVKLNSMTGFGKAQDQVGQYQIQIEIKSVNHRFKDCRIKLPQQLSQFESLLRDMISKNFIRGSFDIFVNVKKINTQNLSSNTKSTLLLDQDRIIQFIKNFEIISEKIQTPLTINPVDFLRSDFFIDEAQEIETIVSENILVKVFNESLKQLKEMRIKEGTEIGKALLQYLFDFENHMATINEVTKDNKEDIYNNLFNKVKKQIEEDQIDNYRLKQELIYYLEKYDVEEESKRIHMHLKKLNEVLNDSVESGRKLEFILQELQREVNTFGVKSFQSIISHHIVDMKTLIEKMREQVLNLE
jgi:uncharacterized protein (TIGR00255 family)